jgi:putative tryptophan/tyrosine transport system substrate-binding protein
MKTKKNELLILILTLFLAINGFAEAPPKILISQVIEHPALNQTTRGIIDALAEKDFKDVKVENAQGSAVNAAQIATKFINKNPDLVVGVGTISAQSFLKYTLKNQVKLVFSTVTDPASAGLITNNVTGVSNFVDLEPQLKLFKRIQPEATKLGIIYNSGESNSIAIIKKLELICPKLGIQLIKQMANNTSDVSIATTKLVNQVDAIFISNDNNALSAITAILQIATKAKIPVYVSDTDAVELGALAALGPNQYRIGLQTGQLIIEILNGKPINQLPVEFPKMRDLYINMSVAKALGIKIYPDLTKEAFKLIGVQK